MTFGKTQRWFVLVALLLVLALAACGANQSNGSGAEVAAEGPTGAVEDLEDTDVVETGTEETEPQEMPEPGRPTMDYARLVARLIAAGAAISTLDPVEQPFFEPPAQVIGVNGNEVQVFEFADPAEAEAAAATVSPSGSSVGTSMMTWISTPHFFRDGRIIILYVGTDAGTLALLSDILGSPFAGGSGSDTN